VAAGLLAARVQESFVSHVSAGQGPASTIHQINHALVRRGLGARFVTLFFARLAPDGRLAYCNAGHNPPMLAGRRGVRRLEQGGLIVGLFPEAAYEEGQERMEPGDVLVVFSDGVSEAMDPQSAEFGDRRIVDCLRAPGAGLEPPAIIESIFAAVREFTAGQRGLRPPTSSPSGTRSPAVRDRSCTSTGRNSTSGAPACSGP
jgi:sigma-B regulation protein RsbU (phosphoserine phosphatase)